MATQNGLGHFSDAAGTNINDPSADMFCIFRDEVSGDFLAKLPGNIITPIAPPGGITGGGVLGFVPKFTGITSVGNSQLFDNAVSIGLGTTTPSASAFLQLDSTTKGFATPRMSTLQRDAIAVPLIGLLVYNTDNSLFSYWDGAVWQNVDSQAGGDISGSGTLNFIPKFTGTTSIGNGTWVFSGNDIFPVAPGNIGTPGVLNRVVTLFMSTASAIDYSDTMTFSEAGSAKVTILTGGNVGIGIAIPSSLLHVAGTIRIGVAGPAGVTGFLIYQNSTNANTVTISSGITSASYALTLPTAQGAVGSFLQNNGAGALSFVSGQGSFWTLTGNSGTTAGTNFVGTTDNISLLFKVGNFKSGFIDRFDENVFLGFRAGEAITLGSPLASGNTAIGMAALLINLTGTSNTVIGRRAFNSNTASSNTSVGDSSFSSNLTGTGNVGLGAQCGAFETGSNSLYIHNGLGVINLTTGKTNSLIYGTFAATTAAQFVRFNANVGILTSTFNGSADGVLNIANGTVPAAFVANQIQIFSVDSSDLTATLGLFLEQVVEAIGTFTATDKIKIKINGVEYWIQLDAV